MFMSRGNPSWLPWKLQGDFKTQHKIPCWAKIWIKPSAYSKRSCWSRLKTKRSFATLRPALIGCQSMIQPSFRSVLLIAGSLIWVLTLAKFCFCFSVASIEVQKSSTVYSAHPVLAKGAATQATPRVNWTQCRSLFELVTGVVTPALLWYVGHQLWPPNQFLTHPSLRDICSDWPNAYLCGWLSLESVLCA